MVNLLPFKALKPKLELVNEVAAAPYDVMSRSEARELIAGKANSILRVTRPDAVLDDQISIDDQEAYDFAQQELSRLIREAVLIYDEKPSYYIYTQQMGEHRQSGIVGLASADDYWADRIKKHEFTLPRKEDDRMKQVLSLGAHLGPVFLTHQSHVGLRELIQGYQKNPADVLHVADDGITHEIWAIHQSDDLQKVQQYFAELDALYIADGHHRAAAAARVSRSLEGHSEQAGHFLTVSFAADELLVLPYHRIVTALPMKPEQFIEALSQDFEINACEAPQDLNPSAAVQFPAQAQLWGMYIDQSWYVLSAKPKLIEQIKDQALTSQLDVSILQDRVLSKFLNVKDPRRCDHIQFVGGIRGFRALEHKTDACNGVAFALYPTSVRELIDIADSGEVMPPKSTWFEPKLRTGLLINVFDQSKLS